LRAARNPCLVLEHRELLVDFVYRHQLLLPPATVRAGHGLHINRLAFLVSQLTSSRIVPEAIFDADDDPEVGEDDAESQGDEEKQRRRVTTSSTTAATTRSSIAS